MKRVKILYSTNSNAAVNFGTGTKNVLGSIPADILATRDENLNFVEGFGTIAGTANALTFTLPVIPLNYSDGMVIAGYLANTNTTAVVTVAVNGLSTKAVKIMGTNPGIGTLVAGQMFVARYNATLGWFELITPVRIIAPTRQYLTSGTTYTTPDNCRQIIVKMVGAGGGGGGYGSAANGGAGGDTTFNGVVAKGGGGGVAGTGGAPGTGGTGGVGSAAFRQQGSGSMNNMGLGSRGGDSRLGFGAAGSPGAIGVNASANSGGGGGGAGSSAPTTAGSGPGGGGEYAELIINSPAATYSYAIGAAGAAGTGSTAGGAGGSGLIIVEEYY